ncbi:MAG: DUF4846 domain-containing protein [Bacteroidales bacterium]|jgi:hypothetical protein
MLFKLSIASCLAALMLVFACAQPAGDQLSGNEDSLSSRATGTLINPAGTTICTRFIPPPGFERAVEDNHSFQYFLRNLPLKPRGAEVKLYNGEIKENRGVYDAVVDMDIGTRDLHQCADAVIRLRAEYLYGQDRHDQIHFNFTNGFRVDYSEWMKGKRVRVDGNKAWWVQTAKPSDTYSDFWNYLETVFMYAGTISLSKELKPAAISDIQTGDVFIRGGSPGHAVIIVDMATDKEDRKVFLLAQSYMPAQELQVLKNSGNEQLSPWYAADFGEILRTPEWNFGKNNLKRFAGE